MDNSKRQCLVQFSELLDRLTIDQIKEVCIPEHQISYAEEMQQLMHDIDLIIEEKEIKLTARFIRLIVILAQINLHIWRTKETMMNDPEGSEASMKLAHQLNGIRNQIKNLLMEQADFRVSTGKRTNINTDNLEGWNISI